MRKFVLLFCLAFHAQSETLGVTIYWKAVEQYFTVMLLFFNDTRFLSLQNLSDLNLALSRVKG